MKTNGETNKLTYSKDRRKDWQKYRIQADGNTDRQRVRQTERLGDIQADGSTDIQTVRHTDKRKDRLAAFLFG
jgi:hypothetical protein